jgi:hypothetical protein
MVHKLSLVCTLCGLFAILTRGPLIFAPNAALGLMRKFAANNTRVRLLSLFILGCGLVIMFAAWDSEDAIGNLLFVFGIILTVVSMVLLIFPFIYRIAVEWTSSLDVSVVRLFGIVGTTIGVFLLYIGLVVMDR